MDEQERWVGAPCSRLRSTSPSSRVLHFYRILKVSNTMNLEFDGSGVFGISVDFKAGYRCLEARPVGGAMAGAFSSSPPPAGERRRHPGPCSRVPVAAGNRGVAAPLLAAADLALSRRPRGTAAALLPAATLLLPDRSKARRAGLDLGEAGLERERRTDCGAAPGGGGPAPSRWREAGGCGGAPPPHLRWRAGLREQGRRRSSPACSTVHRRRRRIVRPRPNVTGRRGRARVRDRPM